MNNFNLTQKSDNYSFLFYFKRLLIFFKQVIIKETDNYSLEDLNMIDLKFSKTLQKDMELILFFATIVSRAYNFLIGNIQYF